MGTIQSWPNARERSEQSIDPTNVGSFLFAIDKDVLSGYPSECAHSTWLGEARAASSGRNTARAERPGELRAEFLVSLSVVAQTWGGAEPSLREPIKPNC